MAAKLPYSVPHLTRMQPTADTRRRLQMRAVKAALEKGEDAHAQLAHELLAALLHVADVEQWQRYNGRWARLSPLAGTTARREYMPDYMLFLAEIVERCR